MATILSSSFPPAIQLRAAVAGQLDQPIRGTRGVGMRCASPPSAGVHFVLPNVRDGDFLNIQATTLFL